MKATNRPWLVTLAAAALIVVVAGCATRPAPDFRGRWKAVNRYAESPEEIPLQKAYLYQPSPMDGTLKNMLTRWAKDSQMTLTYKHPSDFTLYAPVEQISTYYLNQAASLLTTIYAQQQVSVTVQGKQIIVTQSVAQAPAAAGVGAQAPEAIQEAVNAPAAPAPTAAVAMRSFPNTSPSAAVADSRDSTPTIPAL